MKKLFTILCAGILTLGVSAQTQFGATAGLNMANVSGDDVEDTDMRLGIRLGVSAAVPLSDVMTLNTGVLYSVKGYSQSVDLSALGLGTIDMDQSLNYIEIPAMLGFSVSDQISLMAGTYTGFLVGTTVTVDGEDQDADTDGLSSIDFGIGLGAAISVSDAISITAGYQMGLTSLDEDGDAEAKNSNILIGMTYSFGGGY
jgi:hypothetical protein